MKEKLLQLRQDLGALGFASFGLLALAGVFFALVLQPMQAREREVHAALARQQGAAGSVDKVSGQVESLYRYLDRAEETTDWLAKLHAIGLATGMRTRAATYRTQAAGSRLERYEIVLPVSGSYAQIRDFLKRALADIPVLSLDHMSLKREHRTDGTVQAELRLSLHRVKK